MAVRGNAAPAEYDVAKDAAQQGTQAEAQADNAVNPAATPQDGGDPYKNPTGFVGFDQYFNANAGAAKKSADDVNSQVSTQANQANAGLAQAYAGFQQNVGKEVGKASVSGQWNDATFNPGSALEQQYKAAEGARDALGSAGGIQALTKGTGLGAALTQRAGAGQFQHTQDRYSELEKAFGDAQSDAANDNADGRQLAEANRGAMADYLAANQPQPKYGPTARVDGGLEPAAFKADAAWDGFFAPSPNDTDYVDPHTGQPTGRGAVEDPYRAEWEREQAARGKGELVARNPNDKP